MVRFTTGKTETNNLHRRSVLPTIPTAVLSWRMQVYDLAANEGRERFRLEVTAGPSLETASGRSVLVFFPRFP